MLCSLIVVIFTKTCDAREHVLFEKSPFIVIDVAIGVLSPL